MSEHQDTRTPMPNVEAYGRRLTAAARRRSKPARRLFWGAAPIAGLAVLGAGALAAAGELGGSDETRVLERGDVVTLGFEDPDTGEALRCPDGSLFTWTIDTTRAKTPDPECGDGSVPPLYAEYRERQREFLGSGGGLEGARAGLPLDEIPRLPTFEISVDEE